MLSCEICEISKNTFQWLLLRAPNFVTVPRLCTIQNTSNSLTKAQLRTPFLQNSSQWLLSNVRYFFKKGKNRNNFSILLWAYYAWNLAIASKLKSFSFIILKKLLESIVQFFWSVIKRSTSTTSATSRQTYTTSGQTDTTGGQTSTTSKKTSTASGKTSTKSTMNSQTNTTNYQTSFSSTKSGVVSSAIRVTL